MVHIDSSHQPYKVVLESGLKFETRTIVIATGAQYARLPVEDADAFTGRGIYYNATHMEAQLCESEEVVVVGGGNSAGQAAVCLAQSSVKVNLLVRSRKLSDSMSQYLIGRIRGAPKDRDSLSLPNYLSTEAPLILRVSSGEIFARCECHPPNPTRVCNGRSDTHGVVRRFLRMDKGASLSPDPTLAAMLISHGR